MTLSWCLRIKSSSFALASGRGEGGGLVWTASAGTAAGFMSSAGGTVAAIDSEATPIGLAGPAGKSGEAGPGSAPIGTASVGPGVIATAEGQDSTASDGTSGLAGGGGTE